VPGSFFFIKPLQSGVFWFIGIAFAPLALSVEIAAGVKPSILAIFISA